MEFNLLSLIGISLVAMFFGYFFGLFEGRGQGYLKRKKEEPLEKFPSQLASVPPSALPVASTSERSLLQLSLDTREQPCLDLDGKRVDATQLSPDQRKRLISLMLVMRPWVEGVTTSITTERPGNVKLSQTPIPQPVSTRGGTPVTQAAVQEVKPTTMVGQIDAILQSRLHGTPLAAKGVRLIESTEGGVVVMVGINQFPSVGDVSDPDVQAAIRSAISEWEDKYTPG